MSVVRPAAGGGIWVTVTPERFARWAAGFAQRHGGAEASLTVDVTVMLDAADGARAECFAPFVWAGPAASDPVCRGPVDLVAALAAHAAAPRTVGIVLVRRGGFAVGLFDSGRLAERKAGARHVQGKTKAGGWSQQRFARRREGQAKIAFGAAADAVAAVLLPRSGSLDAVRCGGDATALKALRADSRLAPVWVAAGPTAPLLDVPGEPRAADLSLAWNQARSVRIRLVESDG